MNKTVSVIYSNNSLRSLKKLDIHTSKRIVLKIKENSLQSNPLTRAKELTGRLTGKYRYRIGDYRAVFIINSESNLVLLTILNVKHRKDIYR